MWKPPLYILIRFNTIRHFRFLNLVQHYKTFIQKNQNHREIKYVKTEYT